ncbi:amidohydrolase family protein [Phenylobacterium sp. LjRoot219]|uniref:N-acyl-D-amino-acid deacylase family protein n=1 Tax=Phenylobacterium sp. LjRoot219 TaxID=3342283 RepID=UPI003ECE3A5F
MVGFDTIIRGGRVVDGTGSPAYWADLGIRAGRIAEIGDLRGRAAKEVIDAAGKLVAPGHVTQHAHYDVALFWDPYCSNSGENGITTVVNANCGFGVAPVRPQDVERTMEMLATTEQIPVSHQRAALPWDWQTFPEYLDRVEQLPKGVNVLSYLPLNPLLVYVMGVEAAKSRQPNAAEIAEMHRLINEAMDAGAIGISMSVMGEEGNSHIDCDGTPMPTDCLEHDVILEISRALVERGEGVIQLLSHLLIYGDRSVSERMALQARGSGVRLLHNSFMTSEVINTIEEDLAWLDGLRAQGCDIYSSCMVNRGWIEAGLRQLDTAAGQLHAVRRISACNSDEEVLTLLADPDFATAFAEEYSSKGPTNGGNGLEGQSVIAVGEDPALQPYLGRTLGDIAEAEGRHVAQVLIDLGLRSKLALQLKSAQITADDPRLAQRLMTHTAVVTGGSDGGAHTKSFGMGHAPTDIMLWLVREQKLVSVEEMHFHLALKQARSVQIYDRGALLPGFWADILIYDLDDLYFDQSRYEIVHDMPNGDWRRKGKAGGYDYIIVNGVVTHRRDRPTGATPGRLVRVTSDRRATRSANAA